MGFTSVIEAISQIPTSLSGWGPYQRSVWPDYIHFFANWGNIKDKCNIILSSASDVFPTDDFVDFGSIKMYPPELRQGGTGTQVGVEIQIIPSLVVTGSSAKESLETISNMIYTYAIEVKMNRVNEGDHITGYEGDGAFTMAYNKDLKSQAEFFPNKFQIYPVSKFIMEDSTPVKGLYYLHASLLLPNTARNETENYVFTLELMNFERPDQPSTEILRYKIPSELNIILGYDQLSATVYEQSSLVSYGNVVDDTITDFQLIVPAEEKAIVLRTGASGNTQAERNAIIDYYAFPSSYLDAASIYTNNGDFFFHGQIESPKTLVEYTVNLVHQIQNEEVEQFAKSEDYVSIIQTLFALVNAHNLQSPVHTEKITKTQKVKIHLNIKYGIGYRRVYYLSGRDDVGDFKGAYGVTQPTLVFSNASGAFSASATIEGIVIWQYDVISTRNSRTTQNFRGSMVTFPNNFSIDIGSDTVKPTINYNGFPSWWREAFAPSPVPPATQSVTYDSTLKIQNICILASYKFFARSTSGYRSTATFLMNPVRASQAESIEWLMLVGAKKFLVIFPSVSSSAIPGTISPSGSTPPESVWGTILDNTTRLTDLVTEISTLENVDIRKQIELVSRGGHSGYSDPCNLYGKINMVELVKSWKEVFERYKDFSARTGVSVDYSALTV